jgi:hypothetical protein
MEKQNPLHITGLFTLRRHWRLGVSFVRVIPLRSIPTAHCTHSLPALKMLRIFLFGLSNRRKQPERYASFFEKSIKNIDRNKQNE